MWGRIGATVFIIAFCIVSPLRLFVCLDWISLQLVLVLLHIFQSFFLLCYLREEKKCEQKNKKKEQTQNRHITSEMQSKTVDNNGLRCNYKFRNYIVPTDSYTYIYIDFVSLAKWYTIEKLNVLKVNWRYSIKCVEQNGAFHLCCSATVPLYTWFDYSHLKCCKKLHRNNGVDLIKWSP